MHVFIQDVKDGKGSGDKDDGGDKDGGDKDGSDKDGGDKGGSSSSDDQGQGKDDSKDVKRRRTS